MIGVGRRFFNSECGIVGGFTKSWWKKQLGGASADAQSYCAGTLRCLRPSCHTTLFSWSRFNGVTVGALPQTPAGTLSLHPARGRRKGTKSPLDPFWAPRLERVSAALWDSGIKPGSPRPSPIPQSPHPRYTDSTAAPSAGQYPAACSEYPPPAHSHWQSPAA